MVSDTDHGGVYKLFVGYGRGLVGGLLFGLPTLFTMEVWHLSFLMNPARLAGFLLLQLVLLLGYVWVSGFKREHESSFGQTAKEAVETFGLALLESSVLLYLFGQLTSTMSHLEIIAKIVLAAIPVSVGIAIATSELEARGHEGESSDPSENPNEWKTSRQYVKIVGGAFYMGYNFAPLEELRLLSISMEWWKLLLTVLLSVGVTYGMVFSFDMRGGRVGDRDVSLVQHPWTETLNAYAASIAVATLLLYFFDAVPFDSLSNVANSAVILALPCSLGAAAGRLIL